MTQGANGRPSFFCAGTRLQKFPQPAGAKIGAPPRSKFLGSTLDTVPPEKRIPLED
jgi:hypothetical protein